MRQDGTSIGYPLPCSTHQSLRLSRRVAHIPRYLLGRPRASVLGSRTKRHIDSEISEPHPPPLKLTLTARHHSRPPAAKLDLYSRASQTNALWPTAPTPAPSLDENVIRIAEADVRASGIAVRIYRANNLNFSADAIVVATEPGNGGDVSINEAIQ